MKQTILIGLALCLVSTGKAHAGGAAASAQAQSGYALPPEQDATLGTQEQPIPQLPIEINAERSTPGFCDRFVIDVGSMRAAFFGVQQSGLRAGGAPVTGTDPAGDVGTSYYSGVGVEAAVYRSSALYLEGGQVGLYDPLGGDTGAEHWTATAGVEIRF
jgi:hypothetical protein